MRGQLDHYATRLRSASLGDVMAMFRDNLSSGMNYLRRRFSSDDLYRDGAQDTEIDVQQASGGQVPGRPIGGAVGGRKISMPSAPSFPSLSTVQGVTRGFLSQAAAAASNAAANVTGAVAPQRVVFNKEHCKVLLIIDDKHNDWYVYSFIFLFNVHII